MRKGGWKHDEGEERRNTIHRTAEIQKLKFCSSSFSRIEFHTKYSVLHNKIHVITLCSQKLKDGAFQPEFSYLLRMKKIIDDLQRVRKSGKDNWGVEVIWHCDHKITIELINTICNILGNRVLQSCSVLLFQNIFTIFQCLHNGLHESTFVTGAIRESSLKISGLNHEEHYFMCYSKIRQVQCPRTDAVFQVSIMI